MPDVWGLNAIIGVTETASWQVFNNKYLQLLIIFCIILLFFNKLLFNLTIYYVTYSNSIYLIIYNRVMFETQHSLHYPLFPCTHFWILATCLMKSLCYRLFYFLINWNHYKVTPQTAISSSSSENLQLFGFLFISTFANQI